MNQFPQKSVLDWAYEYLDLGFSVIPIKPRSKSPLISWEDFKTRQPTTDEIDQWFTKWPNANIAIVLGSISGICALDADTQNGAEWVKKHFPVSSVYNVTSQFFHLICKVNGTVPPSCKPYPGVELRSDGNYILVPPSVHPSGHIYRWEYTPGLGGWDDLPAFAPPATLAIKPLPDKTGNLNLDLTTTKASPINQGATKGDRNNTLASLAGKWIQSGLDLEEVEILAGAWNQKNQPPLGEKELKTTLRSIWKTHQKNHPIASPTPGLKPEDPCEETCTIPKLILNPGGLLSEIIDYIQNNSPVSVPLFSLAAALSFVGSVVGQKVMTETGLRTNLYCISLGYSGSGKNAPFSTLSQLLLKSSASKIYGPTEITSASAILNWLSNPDCQNVWIGLDEVGQILRGMKNPNAPEAGIPRIFTKLFSGTDRPEVKGYAKKENNIFIPWHHLSLYGASTPERFWESITPGEVADGFLARCLIFESLHDAPLPNYNLQFQTPAKIITSIDTLYSIQHEWNKETGNNPQFHVPIPNVIPKTEEAAVHFNEWAAKYHELKNRTKQNTLGISSIYGRAAEHASKIALIHALSINGNKTTSVDRPSIEWACCLIDFLIKNVIKQIEGNVAENETAKWKQKLIKGIRAYTTKNKKEKGYAGATLRDIQRGPGRGLTRPATIQLLESLLLAESIGVMQHTAKNGAAMDVYYVVSSN